MKRVVCCGELTGCICQVNAVLGLTENGLCMHWQAALNSEHKFDDFVVSVVLATISFRC